MKPILLLSLSILLVLNTLQSQDTILLEKSSRYFSETDTLNILSKKGKNIYFRAKYSKELILFSPNKAKIESCFYYDNQRFKKQLELYFHLKDDTISIKERYFSENWIYRKIENNLYKITRTVGSIQEVGYAKSLIPLEKVGNFYAINMDNDTLYKFQYENYTIPKIIKINTQRSNNKAKNLCEVDQSNTIYSYFNRAIRRIYTIPKFESRITSLIIIEFSISENGQINNINIRNTHNPFLKKAVLNIFGEKEFHKIASQYSNCSIRLLLKEPLID
jgi:hypothetical protein